MKLNCTYKWVFSDKERYFFSGSFKSCVSHNRRQIIEYCLLSKHSQALEPCLWDEKPMDLGVFGSLGVWSYWFCKKKKKKERKKENWLKMIDLGACVDGFSLTQVVILSRPWPYGCSLQNCEAPTCGIAKP